MVYAGICLYRGIWKYMEVYGGIWKCMAVYEVYWGIRGYMVAPSIVKAEVIN